MDERSRIFATIFIAVFRVSVKQIRTVARVKAMEMLGFCKGLV